MTCRRWPLALLTLILAASESHSQIILAGGPYGYGGFGMRYGRMRGPVGFSLGLGGYYGMPIGRMTYVYTQPALRMPPSGSIERALMQGLNTPRVPPEQLAVPAPPFDLPPDVPQPMPRREAPVEKPKPEAPPEKVKPEPKKPKEPRPLPRPPMPEEDPQAESLRLLELGRDAFAAGEYGRAAERFRRAAATDPRQVVAHFFLAQALFALGKYPAAVDAVGAGLALSPDWPTAPFRPLELYGTNVVEYSEHLRRLAEAVRQHPDDADFLFLYAYELWFDGRRDEARLLFERARRHGADPGIIDRFLMALPPGPVL